MRKLALTVVAPVLSTALVPGTLAGHSNTESGIPVQQSGESKSLKDLLLVAPDFAGFLNSSES